MKFGDKLRLQRKKINLTQEGLSEVLGITNRTLGNYENGVSHPQNRKIYFKLAKVFNVDVNYFLTEDEEFLTAAAESYGNRGQRQARELLQQTAALFAGGELSEKDQLAFQLEMQEIFFESKNMARKKYTPKKYRKDNDGKNDGDLR